MKTALAVWLVALDALAAAGLFGSRPYLWAVRKASDATDWGVGVVCGEGAPF